MNEYNNTSQQGFEQVNEIYVDALGVDHEDDLDDSEEDDDATREAAIMEEASNQNWNIVEADPMITASWQGLNSHVQVDDGRQFFRGQMFNSLEELKFELTNSLQKPAAFRKKLSFATKKMKWEGNEEDEVGGGGLPRVI